jgi:hypothetical protein
MIYQVTLVHSQASNNECSSASSIASLPFPETVLNNDGATSAFLDSTCDISTDSQSLWYSYTPGTNDIIQANVVGQSFVAKLATFSGPSCSDLTCIDVTFSSSFELVLEWAGFAGTTYYIVVSDEPPVESGSFTFSVFVSLY